MSATAVNAMRQLAKRRNGAIAAHAAAVVVAQMSCTHPETVEARFVGGLIFDRLPLRVCRACGLQEEGWTFRTLGPGTVVTQDEALKLSRTAVYG